MSVKSQTFMMIDYHGTFYVSTGGIITEKEWSFSAININKAILKLKITNVPSSALGGSGFAIDYYNTATMQWMELGSIEKWWGGDAYKEVDVTSICRANPRFKWRFRVWVPFVIYYSCMGCKAYLYLEYTLGEPEAPGVQSTSPLGYEMFAPVGEAFNLMLNIMLMMMFMSLMMGLITSITGGS